MTGGGRRRPGNDGHRVESLLSDRYELSNHPKSGMKEDVAVHRPSPDGSACWRIEVEGPVIETHPVDELRHGGDVDDVDELVVRERGERRAAGVSEFHGLDREAMGMPGVMSIGVV